MVTRKFTILVALCLWLGPRGASGADGAAEAKQLFLKGEAALKANQWAEACSLFKQSYDLVQKGSTLVRLAECRELSGDLIAARNAYAESSELAKKLKRTADAKRADVRVDALNARIPKLSLKFPEGFDSAAATVAIGERVLEREERSRPVELNPGDYVLSVSAPHWQPWQQSVKLADGGGSTEVSVDARRWGRLTLRFAKSPPQGLLIWVDDKPLSPGLYGQEMEIAPGEHQVVASAPGFHRLTETVTVPPEEPTEWVMELEPVPAPPPVVPAPVPAKPAPVYEQSGLPTGAWIGYGVAAAGFTLWSITGGLAWSKKTQLDDDCPGGDCPPPYHSEVDTVNALATWATIGLGVGIVGAGVGTYFLLASQGDSGRSLRAGLGPQGLRVDGRF